VILSGLLLKRQAGDVAARSSRRFSAARALGLLFQFEPKFDHRHMQILFITKAILCRPIPSLGLRPLVLLHVAKRYREQFLQQLLQQIFMKDRIRNNRVFLDGPPK
jgi:hypothetical protein